jgi:hypothetical protein
MYSYWGFGFNIKSDIAFPELLPKEFDNADINILTKAVPQQLEGEQVIKKVNVSMNLTEYLHKVPNIADYYVANGNEICIQPQPDADEKSIRLFLLSNAMAAILHQRGMIPLHASAVYHDDGIILFCGRSGAGKSTTATALQQKGYTVFSDDVCVLDNNADNELVALPSYPMIKLWEDSFIKIGLGEANKDLKIRPEMNKYARFYHDEFSIAAQKIKRVFILETGNLIDTIEIKKLGPIAAFKTLQQNTYRHVQMNGMKKRDIHFAMMSKLAGQVSVYKIDRPILGNTIEDLITIVESNLAGND